jgi:predicted dienelactone hydrolase
MRPLEILTLLLTLVTLLATWARQERRWPLWLLWLAALSALVHLVAEGYRWQMLPAYVVLAVLLLWWLAQLARPGARLPRAANIAGSALALLLLAVAGLLAYLFPVPVLPPAGGPYAVGTVSYALRDESRPEIYSDSPGDARETMVQFWYPAVPAPGDERAVFVEALDVAAPALAQRLGLPGFLLDHINLVDTGVYAAAQPAREGGPYPLLVFSHGLRGLRVQNGVLMRELASHGYVVASSDHTYGNVVTVFPGGRAVFYDADRVFPEGETAVVGGIRLVDTWAADVRFLLEEATVWNAGDHFLAGMMNLSRTGTLGHSTGGAAAIEVCASVETCGAVVVLDGWIEPVDDAIISAGLDVPLLFLRAPEWLGPGNQTRGSTLYANSGNAHMVTIPGTTHFDYTDIPLLSPLASALGLAGDRDARDVLAIINDYTRTFFDWHLKGMRAGWEALDYDVVVD